MALNVIGESGVRIRPVTSGFVPELQAYIDNTSGRVAAEIPLSIGSVQLQSAIDDLKSSAAGGAVLPIELARKGVDAGLADIRKTAEAGADFALRAQGGALEQTISDAKDTAERGATMPLNASDVDLQASIADARANAEAGADLPLFPGDAAVEAALGLLRGNAEAGASFPIVLDADQAIGELSRFQEVVRGSGTALPLDTSGVVGSLDAAQNSASQFGNQFGGVLDRLNGQIAGLGGGVDGLGRKLVGLLSSPGGALIGGGAIAGAFAGANVLAAGNQRLTRIEDSTAALEIQLGGAKQAADLVAEILKTVNGTPFTLDQFVEAGRTLVTFGTAAEKIPTYLTAIGEAAAGSGQGIEAVGTITDVFAKMQIAGRATTDDWQRLGFVGVNALKIWGNASGKTTAEMQKLVTDGAVPAKDAIDQLIDGITNGSDGVAGKVNKLGGSMEKLRGTFSGAAGGLSAASARLGVAFLEPFRPTTVALLQTATEALDALAPVVRNVLTSITDTSAVKGFITAVSGVPATFDSINAALRDGGIEGALSRIISLSGPLKGTLGSIFDNVQSSVAPLGRILREVAAGFGDAAKILGAGFFAALRAAVNVIAKTLQLLDKMRPVVKAVATAFAVLFVVKRFDAFNSVIQRLNGLTSDAAGAAQESAQAQLEEAAATNVNTAAKVRLAAATKAQSAAAASNLADSQRQFLLNNNSGLGAGVPVTDQTKRDLRILEDSLQKQGRLSSRVGSGLADGIRKAKSSITDFASAFKTEIIAAVVITTLTMAKSYAEAQRDANQAMGADQAKGTDASKSAVRTTKELSDTKGIAEAIAGMDASFSKFQKSRQGLREEVAAQQEILNSKNGLAGLGRKLAGGADQTGFAVFNKLGGGESYDSWLRDMGVAAGAKAELNDETKALTRSFVAETRGWGTLATAIGKTGNAIELLGAKKITDPTEISDNRDAIRQKLGQSKRAANALKGGTQLLDGKDLAAINAQADILSQYSLPSLETALAAAGLDLATVDLNSKEFADAIEAAAGATTRAAAESVGLGDQLGIIATAYDEAKKSADTYVAIAYAQQNSFLEGQVAADNYQQSLANLQYSTDFTASNLQNVAQAMQGQIGAAFTAAAAAAKLSGSTDVTGDAARAAAAEEAKLRESFIKAAEAANYTTDEARRLADMILGIPGTKTINILIKTNDLALVEAQKKLDKLIADQKNNPWLFGGVAIAGARGNRDRIANEGKALDFYQGIINSQNDAAGAAAQDLISSTAQKEAADQARADAEQAAADAKRAAEQAAEEAKRAAEEAAREAERVAEEARRKQEAELQAFLQMVQGIRQASESMKGSFEKLIDTFRQKRQELIGDITKRVEFDPATSVSRLIRNADQRNAALTESQKGLADLRKRGLTEDAVKSLGLTGQAEDAKAIRRLLKASPEELRALSASVGKLGETATQAAYREQGQIIGREIRDVLEAWTETPGVKNPNASVETILRLIRDSKGNSEVAASRIATQLGGVVKR